MSNNKFERLLAKNSYFLTRGHDFVEIGGIKWATCNVGAEKPIDSGLYFAWGETKGYAHKDIGNIEKFSNWNNYKFGDFNNISKYNSTDGKRVLNLEDDPVHANWGGKWRLPTKDEFLTLGASVYCKWVEDYQGSGVSGCMLRDKIDSTKILFFPAAGYCNNGRVEFVGIDGVYWSSSLVNSSFKHAHFFSFTDRTLRWDNDYFRYFGMNIRGVIDY